MTNFEGEIVEDKRKINYATEISDDNDMFQNCYVYINNLDYNIDYTINSTYAYDLGILHKQCN